MTFEAHGRTIPFDPAAEDLPEGVRLPPEFGGEVVVCLLDQGVGPWGEEVVHALARGWGNRGRRVVVVDADFTAPSLHRGVGVPDGEGVTDALFHGASPERIVVPVPDAPYTLVRAGTVVPDPGVAWASDAWDAVIRAFRVRDETLLVVAPGGREGVAALANRADQLYRLSALSVSSSDGVPVIHPPDRASGDAWGDAWSDPVDVPPAEGLTGPDQGLLAVKRERTWDGNEGVEAAGAAVPVAEEPAATVQPTSVRTPERRGRGRLVTALVLGALLILLLFALWLGWIDIGGVGALFGAG